MVHVVNQTFHHVLLFDGEELHMCADTSDSSSTRAMRDAHDGRRGEIEGFAANVPLHDDQRGLLFPIFSNRQHFRPVVLRNCRARAAETTSTRPLKENP